MRDLLITNSLGAQLDLNVSPFMVLDAEGLETPAIGMQTEKTPYQPGVNLIANLFEPRDIVISGIINQRLDLTKIQTYRRLMFNTLSPSNGDYTILCTADSGIVRTITGRTKGLVMPNKPATEAYQKFMLTIRCTDPFWYETTGQSLSIASLRKDWSFTGYFPAGGRQLGTRLNLSGVNMFNAGNVYTPIKITFNGPAHFPIITNTATGEFIQINYNFASGESMVINTQFGKKTVTLNTLGGTISGMNLLNPGSTFFQLQPGNNTLIYSDLDGSTTALCVVAWTNRYVGV